MGKGDQPLVSPQELQGTFVGNGCVCSPECMTVEVKACGPGICVLQYCAGFPIPCVCQFMLPCFGRCYTDCDDEGYWTPDKDHIDARCGRGFVRKGGAPPDVRMQR